MDVHVSHDIDPPQPPTHPPGLYTLPPCLLLRNANIAESSAWKDVLDIIERKSWNFIYSKFGINRWFIMAKAKISSKLNISFLLFFCSFTLSPLEVRFHPVHL